MNDAALLDYVVCPCNPWNGRNSEPCAIELRDGRLLLTWSSWTTGSGADTAAAEIRAKISSDEGTTWSESFLWQGPGEYSACEDPALAWLPSGKLGFAYFARYAELHRGCEGPAIVSFFRKSEDAGVTWTEPKLMNPPGVNVTVAWWDRLRVSKSGRILTTANSWWRDLCFPDRDRQDRSNVFVLYSDDEGETWGNSNALAVEFGDGFKDASEPGIEQFSDGTWMMTLRNPTGRAFKSYSTDDGATWSKPEPAALAASNSPIVIRRRPGTDDLLTVWNQASKEEIRRGHGRHRLSCAISKDRGNTWTHFRNLESNDTRTFVEPPAVDGLVAKDKAIKGMPLLTALETDHELVATPYTNCSYPAVLFFEGLALITYDVGGPGTGGSSLKLRRMPIGWFYEK
ncbi:MAG: sialidase family protein [Planctomycetota bacterium]